MKSSFPSRDNSAPVSSPLELCFLVVISPLLFVVTFLVLLLSLLSFSLGEFAVKRRQLW